MKITLYEMTTVQGRTNGRLDMAKGKISGSENSNKKKKESKMNQKK